MTIGSRTSEIALQVSLTIVCTVEGAIRKRLAKLRNESPCARKLKNKKNMSLGIPLNPLEIINPLGMGLV